MAQIKIVRKNDEFSPEYQVGDIFDMTGTWYGGCYIEGHTGVPVPLDKEEYVEIDAEKTGNAEKVVNAEKAVNAEEAANAEERAKGEEESAKGLGETRGSGSSAEVAGSTAAADIDTHGICVGDIVQHFKREGVDSSTSEYIYKVLAFASHTESGEDLVIYQALYAPFKVYARPYALFMSKVDSIKYPTAAQTFRFEKLETQ